MGNEKKINGLVRANLEGVLRRHGFETASDDLFFVRVVGDVIQSVFFSKSRYKDQYAVVCSLVELDDGFVGKDWLNERESRERIAASATKFALSPIAPFQNTYDWMFGDENEALVSTEEIATLLEAVALPVFSKIGSSILLRKVQTQVFMEQVGRSTISFLADELSRGGFQTADTGEFLWKRNGEIFAIILPSVVGFGSFLKIHVLLWSPLLHGTKVTSDVPPSNFSRVSFACLSTEGMTDDGVDALWPVDIDGQKQTGLDRILRCLTGSAFVAWLQQHQTVASMLEVVSVDLRPYVQRHIAEATEQKGAASD